MPDPALLDLRILQGTNWTKPFRVLLDDGTLLDTSGYTARMQVRAEQESSTAELDCTVANGLLEVGFDPPPWEATTAYGVGQQVVPAAGLNGYVYECTVAGTSDSGEPTWPTTIDQTVTDDSVTWICRRTDAVVTNLRIVLLPGDTDALDTWGNGYWDLELVDPYSKVLRLFEGRAVLSREITR